MVASVQAAGLSGMVGVSVQAVGLSAMVVVSFQVVQLSGMRSGEAHIQAMRPCHGEAMIVANQ